jgi:hypothetical protein
MWINLIGLSASGDTVFQSGVYDADSASLLHHDQLKVYEAIQALTESTASQHGLRAGPSFHFFLNDTIVFDNRIPPRGFTNDGFRSRRAEPVGVTYADSQYWDVSRYTLPASTAKVIATLYYQTISKEYVEFLRDENLGNFYDWNEWGTKLYDAWKIRGKSQPVVMNSRTVIVRDSVTSMAQDQENPYPSTVVMMQNHPNPFNPKTDVRYQISEVSDVALRVYNVLGREVATLVDEVKEPGFYSVSWDARSLPSGIYFYSLSIYGKTQTKKMLLIR